MLGSITDEALRSTGAYKQLIAGGYEGLQALVTLRKWRERAHNVTNHQFTKNCRDLASCVVWDQTEGGYLYWREFHQRTKARTVKGAPRGVLDKQWYGAWEVVPPVE